MKKKRHKKENSSSSGHSPEGPKQNIFRTYIKEMEEKTGEFIKKNPALPDTKFYLFQTIQNKDLVRDMIFNLAYFYDVNYIGNKDFIHIPNISNILDNILKYPIMLATQKDEYGTEDILGVTTVKIENNKSISDNPYFPTSGETVLTITGVLTKMNAVNKNNNRIRGIGKELIKSSVRAAYNVNKQSKIKLICEVDCRNLHSFNAVVNAIKELQTENTNVNVAISGYYEILNSNGDLQEAPTFVLEIYFDENKAIENKNIEFNYLNCKSTELFSDLNNVIEENTKELKEYVNRKDNKTIIYHSLESINALNVSINAGNTADGNERTPSIKELEYVQNDSI